LQQKSELTDIELLQAFIEKNDTQALSIFFKNQSGKLFRIAYNYLHNEADVEDVLQSAFITIMEKLKGISKQNISNEIVVRAWCAKIVINLCLVKLRENKNRLRREVAIGSQKMQSTEEIKDFDTTSLSNESLSKELDMALNELPIKYRLPILFRYVEKMEFEEISNILMEKPATIRVQLKRGLEKLGVLLKERGVVTTGLIIATILSGKPLQAASSGTSQIIENVIFERSNQIATRLYVNENISLIKNKTVLLYISAGLITLATIFYIVQIKNINQIVTVEKRPDLVKNDYTNCFWDFTNENIKNIFIIEKSLFWKKEKKCHSSNENQMALFKLNLTYQDKPFFLLSLIYTNTSKTNKLVSYRIVWEKDGHILKHNRYVLSATGLEGGINMTHQSYAYKNYIVNILNGKNIEVLEYENIPKNAMILCGAQDFMIKSIKSETIEPEFIPKKILDAINAIQNQKPASIFPDINYLDPNINKSLKF
jgi:RNA polymerase sigma-70 factor (ECF subfamily)